MNRTLILVLFLTLQCVWGQNLSKQKLLEDLQFLNEAVVNGHPVNYHPQNRTNIQSVIDNAKAIPSDSVTPWEYTLWIEKGIFHIGCSHTSLKKNPLITKSNQKFSFIPLTARIQNHQLIITDCADNSKKGQSIEQINGISSTELINTYREYKASDGKTEAFALTYFALVSSKLLSNYVKNPDIYNIKTSESEFELKGINSIYFEKNTLNNSQPLLSKNGNRLDTLHNFAIIKVNAFNKNDKSFFNTAFNTIDKLKKDTLFIDLRQNTGGNIKAAATLTKHLINHSFSYSILHPQLKPLPFLNTKGKLFWSLSKLKYNVGAIHRMKKSPLGNQFHYDFSPAYKANFKGAIFVLTDGFTASASTMVTSWLKLYSQAVFMGSQACGGYNGNNGGSFPLITLPNSKMEIVFPIYRLIIDTKSDQQSGLLPDIQLPYSVTIPEIIPLMYGGF